MTAQHRYGEGDEMMDRNSRSSRRVARLLAVVGGLLVVLAATVTACADPRADQPLGEWIMQNSVPLDTVDPAAPLDDLAPVRQSIGPAEIVGLGESAHGTAEQITLKHRVLRLLVEQMGFRSIAWEDDWTAGLEVNDYINTGGGDLDALMTKLAPQWQSRQVAEVLRWLREFNSGRADKVQFVGVEYYLTRASAYDGIDAFVVAAAPERLTELRDHQRLIRPATSNIFEHIQWYASVADKEPFLRAARQVYELVDGLPHEPGDGRHARALHHARQIVSFYEHLNLPESEALVYRDVRAAENLRWWRDHSGDKIVYWGASAHTANAPELRIANPSEQQEMRFPSAGSYLRRWYGAQYLSIGFTFDHGEVSVGPDQAATMAEPAVDWFERPIGETRVDQLALDLRAPASPSVRDWLAAPIKTRGLSHHPTGSYMDGGTLGQWFDVIVHRQQVTPTQPA
jgi:erythromycin esterase-like protein